MHGSLLGNVGQSFVDQYQCIGFAEADYGSFLQCFAVPIQQRLGVVSAGRGFSAERAYAVDEHGFVTQ